MLIDIFSLRYLLISWKHKIKLKFRNFFIILSSLSQSDAIQTKRSKPVIFTRIPCNSHFGIYWYHSSTPPTILEIKSIQIPDFFRSIIFEMAIYRILIAKRLTPISSSPRLRDKSFYSLEFCGPKMGKPSRQLHKARNKSGPLLTLAEGWIEPHLNGVWESFKWRLKESIGVNLEKSADILSSNLLRIYRRISPDNF